MNHGDRISFEFACRDDCLAQMLPSDLRRLVAERDAAEKNEIRHEETISKLGRENARLVSAVSLWMYTIEGGDARDLDDMLGEGLGAKVARYHQENCSRFK